MFKYSKVVCAAGIEIRTIIIKGIIRITSIDVTNIICVHYKVLDTSNNTDDPGLNNLSNP